MPENFWYIALGLASAGVISLLLFIARKLLWNEVFEVKARRLLDFLDEKEIRLAISFLNQTRQTYRIKDLKLCYVLGKKVYLLGQTIRDPMVQIGASGDVFHKDGDGVFSVPVSPHTKLEALYTFSLVSDHLPEGAKTMLSYIDERGRRHYAEFSLSDRYGQLLSFKRRSFKEE